LREVIGNADAAPRQVRNGCPGRVRRVRLRLGEHALSLGHGYLDADDLDRARHWFAIAIDYETPDATRALAEVNAMQRARTEYKTLLDDSETQPTVAQTVPTSVRADDADPRDDAAGLVQQAKHAARQIVDDAEEEAERVVAAAHFRAAVLILPSLDDGSADAVKGDHWALLSKVLNGRFDMDRDCAHKRYSEFSSRIRGFLAEHLGAPASAQDIFRASTEYHDVVLRISGGHVTGSIARRTDTQ
jgi:hypothetical protein